MKFDRSTIQQERVRKQIKQHGQKLNKIRNGCLNTSIALPLNSENYDATKRRFGGYKSDEILDDEDKAAKLSCTFETSPMRKYATKPTNTLRVLSNDNSNFVNVSKSNFEHNNVVRKREVEEPIEESAANNIGAKKHVPFCSKMPSTSSSQYPPALSHSNRRNSGSTEPIKHEQSVLESWIKRKFYIVENSGKATEVYCTDLIHRAKQGIRHGSDDNHSLLRCVDKWREEWNHGVQMPLGTNKETFQFEHNSLFSKMAEPECFQLPVKLISLDQSNRYTKTHRKDYFFLSGQPLFYYNLDHDDELWLEKPTGSEQSITSKTFVEVMNCLEVLTYQKIHDALLEPFKSTNSDDDAECIICRLPVWETGDQIVFCDGCNIAVHQVCYGISDIPTGQWFCQLCEYFGGPTSKECLFCPIKGGAMKATKHMESWAHVVCALYLSEVRFGDAEAREPITHVNEIPAEKWQARCSVCDTCRGACIKCTYPKCDETFHVSCAQRANFELDIKNDDDELNGVKYISHCHKHSFQSRSRHIPFNKNRLSEMYKSFKQYVDPKDVACYLNLSVDIVERIFAYWIFKRKNNAYRPLITEPEGNKLFLFDQITSPADLSKQKKISARKRRMAQNAECEVIPHKQLIENYEGIRQLRIRSEKARNLCYMVSRREKLKKQSIELFEQQIQSTGQNVFSSVVPVSSRRMGRLLLGWKQSVSFEADTSS